MRKTNLPPLLLALVFAATACNKADDLSPLSADGAAKSNAGNKFYGPTHPVGKGTMRAWTRMQGGVPVEIGVDMTRKALDNLPHHDASYVLHFHPVHNSGTYKHMTVDWAQHGHGPAFYEVPHFDFHFYTQTLEERLAIAPGDPGIDELPAPMYIPDNHIPAGGVPQMGMHWVDLLAPELNGEPFTRTFIYGSYGGEVTFYEPMITLEWLMQQQSATMPIPQPQAFQHDGYYPMSYSVTRTANPETWTVSMALEFRTGS
jgi:hypothetical protein